uniref:Uncharacterized protein n=1 Tax=Anguilla anguilla TaxID=7936 RepID=A0A0E9PPD9_ANGAN
MNIYKYINI